MNYLDEAFQALNSLNEESFTLSELDKIEDVLDDDKIELEVIDLEAEDADDLQDDYVGKVITQCNVCKTLCYKDPTEIVIDEDEGCVNKDEECPVCLCQEGYKIVGQVADYATDSTVQDEDTIDAVDNDEMTVESEELTEAEDKHFEKRDGTIASLLNKHMDELAAISNVNELKAKCLELVNNSDIKDTAGAKKFIQAMNSKKSTGALLSTIGTFITGLKVESKQKEIAGLPDDLWTTVYDNLVAGADRSQINKLLDYKYNRYPQDSAYVGRKLEDDCYTLSIKIGKDQSTKPIEDIADKLDLRVEKREISDPYWKAIYKIYIPQDQVSLEEDFKEVKIKTDDQEMEMTSDDKGKVVVTTEPVKHDEDEEEVIKELDDETVAEIDANQESEEDEEVEVQLDDFDEESFDELGENYLKEVYDNIKSFKTTEVRSKNNKLTVEGLITFNSGKNKATKFIFEADTARNNKVRFKGSNKQLASGNKAFSLNARVRNNKVFCESLTYNYRVKAPGAKKSNHIYGNIKRSKRG